MSTITEQAAFCVLVWQLPTAIEGIVTCIILAMRVCFVARSCWGSTVSYKSIVLRTLL